jgi:hypothetical protein
MEERIIGRQVADSFENTSRRLFLWSYWFSVEWLAVFPIWQRVAERRTKLIIGFIYFHVYTLWIQVFFIVNRIPIAR